MKRYRVMNLSFDSRANFLSNEISEDWKEEDKLRWKQNRQFIYEGIIHTYGIENYENKLSNFSTFGTVPFSIIAFQLVLTILLLLLLVH